MKSLNQPRHCYCRQGYRRFSRLVIATNRNVTHLYLSPPEISVETRKMMSMELLRDMKNQNQLQVSFAMCGYNLPLLMFITASLKRARMLACQSRLNCSILGLLAFLEDEVLSLTSC